MASAISSTYIRPRFYQRPTLTVVADGELLKLTLQIIHFDTFF